MQESIIYTLVPEESATEIVHWEANKNSQSG